MKLDNTFERCPPACWGGVSLIVLWVHVCLPYKTGHMHRPHFDEWGLSGISLLESRPWLLVHAEALKRWTRKRRPHDWFFASGQEEETIPENGRLLRWW
jgi:hypothetical protein